MIRTILGPDAFRAGMDLYFQRHDGEAATIHEDFLAASPTHRGRDLSRSSPSCTTRRARRQSR